MQFQSIRIRNVLGARRVDIDMTTPITLIAGLNGAAKSSIQESIRMALTGETLRVNLKRDYPTMISEGAKAGSVAIATDVGVASYALPDGTQSLEGELGLGLPDALPYVLNAQGFSSMTDDDRRTFLFSLTGCAADEKRIRTMLLEAGCDAKLIDETLPMLKSITGFPAAAKFAAGKSTEAKGAWRATTGETYGSKKADGWSAEKPVLEPDDDGAAQALSNQRDTLETQIREAQTELGALQQQVKQANACAQAAAEAEEARGRLPRLEAKLGADKKMLAEMEQRVADAEARAGEAPRNGLVHDFARAAEFVLENLGDDPRPSIAQAVATIRKPFDGYVEQFGLPSNNDGDPEARERLPQLRAGLETARNAVRNTERDITATTAKAQPVTMYTSVDEATLAKQQGTIDSLVAQYRDVDERYVAMQAEAKKAAEADAKTTRAAELHAEVSAWATLAEQLGPDGIPAQLLAQALKPVNTALRKSSMTTGWRQIAINPDMTITGEGRAYNLLCESEKWRADAMIAEAIAQISGTGVLMLDRMDVLDLPGRVELLTWLAGRVDDQAPLNTVLLFGTFKQQPSGLPSTIRAVWIENGELDAAADEHAAAA
ncbi:AAA family ATPase [Burkholderia anthina]|uniref:AAA family ATPase n=1 Tax=Burkholderia anthina TaxID=179879 RepID=UPI001589AE84|nr:AAA family ATPase [Burkholderia anthina]